MAPRRARNLPRHRLMRARHAQAQDGQGRAPGPRGSEVVARSLHGQSRLNRISPTRTVVTSFLVLCVVGALVLMIPGMRADGVPLNPLTALFTAVSAICVTGLSTVDTEVYWSTPGQVTIMLLVQVGGFGIQALGTLWILLLNRRLGTSSRLAAQAETGALTPGDVRRVLQSLAGITLTVEFVVALVLGLRFWSHYHHSPGSAAWFGLFHSVTAVNNAGFDLLSEIGPDPVILGALAFGVIVGGIGFLVVVELFSRATGARPLVPRSRPTGPRTVETTRARARELARRSRYRLGAFHPERFGFANPIPLSLHTRLMLGGTAVLILGGSVAFIALEWRNPGTMGALSWWEKLQVGIFSGGVTPRTAGFAAVDYEQVVPETRLVTDVLMFIGGGSGSTAGGIKVTTWMILVLAARAVIRGERDINASDRRISDTTVRVAIAVTMTMSGAVIIGTVALEGLTSLGLDHALFEVISALATVGLSANVTPHLGAAGQLLVIALMFLGRVGPLTLASSLTLREDDRAYRLPEGRPMIG